MGSNKIDKEQEKVLYKQMFARALNVLRTTNQDWFYLDDLIRELPTIPKVKRKYIVSQLIRSGVIVSAGRDKSGNLFWFKDARVPINVADLNIPIEQGLVNYYTSISEWSKTYTEKVKKGEVGKKEKEKEKEGLSFEEECIKYLLSTGKYKIYQSHTEWIEIK